MTQPLAHPLAWKVYTVLIIVGNVVTIVLGGPTVSNLATGAVSLILCVPLVGYSWQRPLGARWLAKAAFLLGIVAMPFTLALGGYQLGVVGVLIGLVVLLLFVPFCYASFLLGYRSEHLWSNRTPQPIPVGAAGRER